MSRDTTEVESQEAKHQRQLCALRSSLGRGIRDARRMIEILGVAGRFRCDPVLCERQSVSASPKGHHCAARGELDAVVHQLGLALRWQKLFSPLFFKGLLSAIWTLLRGWPKGRDR